jgi:outer membrane protein TolC
VRLPLLAPALLLPRLIWPGLAAAGGPPPSAALLRQLEQLERQLGQLDRVLEDNPAEKPAASLSALSAAPAGSLRAPAPLALPSQPQELAIRQELRLSLPQAQALALSNDLALQERQAQVRETQGLVQSARGLYAPVIGIRAQGGYGQQSQYNFAPQNNYSLYPEYSSVTQANGSSVKTYAPGAGFRVAANGWNALTSGLADFSAGLRLEYNLLDFSRGPTLASRHAQRQEADARYGDQLRATQLAVSSSFYRLQLAQQQVRIREAVLANDLVIQGQVQALKRSGLVPRLDTYRIEARRQEDQRRLLQALADRRSRERELSNLLNVAFSTTLTAGGPLTLQPPWPLDLESTLVQGFHQNPQLLALRAAREALLRQADAQAAQLLPNLGLFAEGGYGQNNLSNFGVTLRGCCGATHIPVVQNQQADWAAGLRLNWRLFDGGISAGQVAASRAGAERLSLASARERNRIRQELETAFFDHEASLAQVLAARAAYRASREALRDARARYGIGLADYTDVSDSLRELTVALEAKAEAITLANLSYARLLRELTLEPPATSS